MARRIAGRTHGPRVRTCAVAIPARSGCVFQPTGSDYLPTDRGFGASIFSSATSSGAKANVKAKGKATGKDKYMGDKVKAKGEDRDKGDNDICKG